MGAIRKKAPAFPPDMAQKIADTFVAVLRRWIKDPGYWDGDYADCKTAKQAWDKMCATNAKAGPGICASHDWCDANMAMAEAFERNGLDPLPRGSRQREAMTDLWGEAWDLAMPALGGKTRAQWAKDDLDIAVRLVRTARDVMAEPTPEIPGSGQWFKEAGAFLARNQKGR